MNPTAFPPVDKVSPAQGGKNRAVPPSLQPPPTHHFPPFFGRLVVTPLVRSPLAPMNSKKTSSAVSTAQRGLRDSRPDQFQFRLYIAGEAQNSVIAVANLNALCRVHLADRYEIEIVDVLREPGRALADAVFMTPTLVKLGPSPMTRIVGNLSELEPVLHVLGLDTAAA